MSATVPKLIRISDDQILVIETGTIYSRIFGSRVDIDQPGNNVATVAGDAAENLWVGLCAVAVDWRHIALRKE